MVKSKSYTPGEMGMNHDGELGGDLQVVCSASVSDTDPLDDLNTTFQWCYHTESGDTCTAENEFSVSVDESYIAELTYRACDAYGACGEATVLVYGVELNNPPVAAIIQPSENEMQLNHDGSLGGDLSIVFDASNTVDEIEDELTFIWSYDNLQDTMTDSAFLLTREIDEDYSDFVVSLTVVDSYGAQSANISVTIIPVEPNDPPIADAVFGSLLIIATKQSSSLVS